MKVLLTTLLALSSSLFANEVKVVDVKANYTASKICTFNVTLDHQDSGWKHL